MTPEEIKSMAREIAESVVRGEALLCDIEAKWPEASMKALMNSGLAGLTIPKKYGGLGGGLLSLTQVSEIIGKECASAAMCFSMHCVGAAVISAKATSKQVDEFLAPIIVGQHITSLALSEPGSGSHFYFPETRMSKTTDGSFTIDGVKSFVTSGPFADSFVASTAAANSDAPVGEFSMVVVSRGTEGLEWQEPWNGFGMRGNASSTVKLNGVRLSSDRLLGEEGDQIWYVFEVVTPYFLMAMAGTYLGVAQAALCEVLSHLEERKFTMMGSGLSNVSILQHRIGILWSRLESTRQLVFHAARLSDSGSPETLPALLSAKAEVGDCVTSITNEAMSLAGGKAYGENSKLARLLRDARAAHVMAPTTDMLRTWTGRALLGLPLLGES